jgi:DNA-directed RNA polymerase specialized sigma24 family protein
MWSRAVTQRSGLSIAELAHRCAEAMSRFQRKKPHDSSSCYELFRRALREGDQEAWSALYHQYNHLVRSWLRPPPRDPDGLVNEAFERFWKRIPAERFDAFPSLPALLAYLERCAMTLAIDEARREERRKRATDELIRVQRSALTGGRAYSQEPMPEHVLERASRDQFYEYIGSRLKGRKERLVFRASFVWGLRPREIVKQWPDRFADAKEVSRVKERLLRRLRRDDQLRAIWETWFPTAEKPGYGRSMV